MTKLSRLSQIPLPTGKPKTSRGSRTDRVTRASRQKKPIEDRMPLIMAFAIPILIMLGVFAGKGIYPFGDNSFLRTDLYHQYAPFYMDFLRRLKSGSSLTYAWEIGLGSNYIALMAYYLTSPFNILLLLCPEGAIVEFITYMIVLKIGLCGLTMAYYLGSKYNTRHMGIAFFGICYALCGYMAAYSWNIMWLDCLWLAPLVILGLERLVKENRPFLYIITLALSILTNYYISIMLCIFLVLYFICLVAMMNRQTIKQYLVKGGMFALSSLIGGGIAAIIVIPAAYALMTTASAETTFPTVLTSYFSIVEMMARHLALVETEIGLDHWPNIYCGVATFLFLPMYYMNRDISYKEKIGKSALLVIFLLSFSLNIPNYIWHGFHYPNSLPCRQSFLYTILILSMGFEGFRGVKSLSKSQIMGTFWGVTAFVLVAQKIIDAEEFTFRSFYVSLAFIAAYTLLLYLYKTEKMESSTAIIIGMGVLVMELGLNTAMTSVTTTSRSDYWSNTENYQTLLETAEEESDTLFYRVEKSSRRTKNDGAWVGYTSASIFSSTTNAGISDIYAALGLEGNTNAYSFTGATPLTASLLSVKYTLSTSALDDSTLWDYVDSADGTYLYENLYTLSVGFMIPSDTEDLWTYDFLDPADAQNAFVSLTAGTGEVLTAIEGTTSGAQFTAYVEEYSHVYVYVSNNVVDNVTATVNGSITSFSNVSRGYLLDLGYVEADSTITLTTSDEATLDATAYVFNDDAFIEAYEVLSSQSLEVTSSVNTLFKTSLTGTVTAETDGLLFTSIPYENGWVVKVDGEIVETEAFADAFLAVELSAGTHTVEFIYHTEGLNLGILLTVLCLALLIAAWFFFDRTIYPLIDPNAQKPLTKDEWRSRWEQKKAAANAEESAGSFVEFAEMEMETEIKEETEDFPEPGGEESPSGPEDNPEINANITQNQEEQK